MGSTWVTEPLVTIPILELQKEGPGQSASTLHRAHVHQSQTTLLSNREESPPLPSDEQNKHTQAQHVPGCEKRGTRQDFSSRKSEPRLYQVETCSHGAGPQPLTEAGLVTQGAPRVTGTHWGSTYGPWGVRPPRRSPRRGASCLG